MYVACSDVGGGKVTLVLAVWGMIQKQILHRSYFFIYLLLLIFLFCFVFSEKPSLNLFTVLVQSLVLFFFLNIRSDVLNVNTNKDKVSFWR